MCWMRGAHLICTYCFNELQHSSAMSQAISCQSLSVEDWGISRLLRVVYVADKVELGQVYLQVL